VLGDYIPFMALLSSLYVIAGGIHLSGDLRPTPAVNSAFLGAGAFLSSFIGTTGASMLLVRPLIRTNHERRRKAHTVVFFIFLVSNTGGCLTPLGDPPLFLGYLRGVPFGWTARSLFLPWLFVNVALLFLFYLWDRAAYAREKPADLARDVIEVRPLRLRGWLNFLWLIAVVATVATVDHQRPFLGTGWTPPLFLRECLLLFLAALSLYATPGSRGLRRQNDFTFAALGEVACLFLGIFICMQTPIEYLKARGPELGLKSPAEFFWATGALSSFLDNAPTYVVFFTAAGGAGIPEQSLLVAISLGAVFMGANTYIGNGPNFMVKAIAEKSGVKMPSFFGYMAYSGCVLLPLFAAVTFIFLRA